MRQALPRLGAQGREPEAGHRLGIEADPC